MNQDWADQDDLRVVQGFLKGLPGASEALGDRLACVTAYVSMRNSRLGFPLKGSALDDLRQDCQIAILESVESYTGESSIAAWAHGFVRFGFLKFFRNRRGEQAKLERLQADYREPECHTLERSENAPLEQVLAELAPKERRTLSMRILEEMSFADIARVLHEPVTTTKSRFVRLVLRLGSQLQTFWKSEYNEGNE